MAGRPAQGGHDHGGRPRAQLGVSVENREPLGWAAPPSPRLRDLRRIRELFGEIPFT